MFEGLQKKWKVSRSRLLLILISFAVGGSITGWLARKILGFAPVDNTACYFIIYIMLLTLLWPMMVLLISIPFGQLPFFKEYLQRVASRSSNKPSLPGSQSRQQRPRSAGPVRNAASDPAAKARPLPDSGAFSVPGEVKHLAIFASGAGSNAQKIIDYFRTDPLVRIGLIISNKPGAGVTHIAKNENIPLLLIEKERFFRGDGYLPEFMAAHTDLIVLAGFLWKVPLSLITAFPRKIVNIHPALLPKFGGKGMYGQYVHEAVLQAGELESGITIHYVDEHYDNGDIIFQTGCPVLEGDSPEDLANRIHQLEHLYYPATIEKIVKNEL